MRQTLLALSFATLPAMLPGAAFAQMGGATCTAGAGCRCFVVEDTGLFPILLGETAAGQVALRENIVLDRSSNTTFRTSRALSDVHRSFGGNGDCPSDDPPGDILPLDGTWIWRTLGEETRGCPAMMAASLAAGRQETLVQNVIWNGAFHPGRLSENLPQPDMAEMQTYEWRKIGPNRWLSDNLKERQCEDGTCVDVALALTMNVVAPDRITGLLTLRSKVEGAQAAILSQFGMSDCNIRVRYRIEHGGR
jgi:hypothetical protein